MTTLVFFGMLGAIAFWLFSAYNRMIEVRNRVTNAFAQIDVQLKRRHDLIPNLVETAKGYMAHERETLEAVITARQVIRWTRPQWPRFLKPKARSAAH
jgi:LemA protein